MNYGQYNIVQEPARTIRALARQALQGRWLEAFILLIVAAAAAIVHEAVLGLWDGGVVPENLGYGVVIMLISIIVNLAVSQRLLTVARKTHSQALEADGLHLRADISLIQMSHSVILEMISQKIFRSKS